MGQLLYLDTETRSEVSIGNGVYRYVGGNDFGITVVTWAFDNNEVKSFHNNNNALEYHELPIELREGLENPDITVVIHNSAFDRRVIEKAWGFAIPTSRIIDTMVVAAAHALPHGLEMLGEVLGLGSDKAKLKVGKALIRKFCVPQVDKDTGEEYFHTVNEDTQEDWDTFIKYAEQDISAMRECYRLMPKLNYPKGIEHTLWQLDQETNDRGILVDVEMAQAAVKVVEAEKVRLAEEMQELSNGEVEASTKNKEFLDYVNNAFGLELPNLQKSTLDQLLSNSTLDTRLRMALENRAEASSNASAKYAALLKQVDSRGRLHDTLQFCGASRTGRDAGRVFQPQNLPRTTMWKDLEGLELAEAIKEAIEQVKDGSVRWLYDNPKDVLSNLLRSVVIAPRGSKIAVADLSNIEGRNLVWLANEDWKLDYFRKYDAGEIKFDNYVAAYAKAMNIDPASVTKYMRQIGKVMELGLGYQGGVAAFLTFAATYGLDIAALADAVEAVADPAAFAAARDKYAWALKNGYTAGLNQKEYAACEYLKTQWREGHPAVVRLWNDMDATFRLACEYHKVVLPVEASGGKIKMYGVKGWVFVNLPSGRTLCYFSPKVMPDGITYLGVDSTSKTWKRQYTYGGKLVENATQAVARDVMFHSIPAIEEAGYKVIMRVHDELVTECPDSIEFSHEVLAHYMATPHEWCKDLPLAAAGFTDYRYRGKD